MIKRLRRKKKQSVWSQTLPTLTWRRLRYASAQAATKGLLAAARNLSSQTVVLCFTDDPLPSLWIGLPSSTEWVVEAVLNYKIKLSAEAHAPDVVTKMSDVAEWRRIEQWPAKSAWVGLVAFGQLYEAQHELASGQESAEIVTWPSENGYHSTSWQLPAPVLGLATKPRPETVYGLPQPLQSNGADHYLGRVENNAVSASGRVQVWGERQMLNRWTVALTLHRLTQSPMRVIVIDGIGDLTAQLIQYKPVVSAAKRKALRIVNMDDDLRRQGWNPMVALGKIESAEETAQRWQRWLNELGVWPPTLEDGGLAICRDAVRDGISTMPTFKRWASQYNSVSQSELASLQRSLRRIEQNPRYTAWLRNPRPLFDELPEGGLVFACRVPSNDIVRKSMLSAVLDAVLADPAVNLIISGVDSSILKHIAVDRWPISCVMVNGIKLPNSLQGIGCIANARNRERMALAALGYLDAPLAARTRERLNVAPDGSVLWLTTPPTQTFSA